MPPILLKTLSVTMAASVIMTLFVLGAITILQELETSLSAASIALSVKPWSCRHLSRIIEGNANGAMKVKPILVMHGSCSSYLPERVFSDSGYSQNPVTGKRDRERYNRRSGKRDETAAEYFVRIFIILRLARSRWNNGGFQAKIRKKFLERSHNVNIWVEPAGRLSLYRYL